MTPQEGSLLLARTSLFHLPIRDEREPRLMRLLRERIEAQNRTALKSHFATLRAAEEAEANGYFSEPDWREVYASQPDSPARPHQLVARRLSTARRRDDAD
jgi:hypothetical protein